MNVSDTEVQKLHAWIDSHTDEIVEALQGVLRIPSVEAPSAGPGAPFGLPVKESLAYSLALCERLGFRTKNVDGYAGHAEFGQGNEMVAALGHLDVVPEGDRWSHAPYGGELDDGYLYARGASDDKGPTYAALFGAAAILHCGLPVNRRIRIIFGCNEESGFACVEHYFKVANEERPLYAFTPDAGFPLIYAEKGIADLVLEKPMPQAGAGVRIASAAGGRRPNMVPDYAEAALVGEREELERARAVLEAYWDKNVAVAATPTGLVVRAVGKSAHGARPSLGDNAVSRLAKALASLDLPDTEIWLNWIAESVDTTGAALGIAKSDDVAGPLTSNLGILETTPGGRIRVTYNVRYPVTWSFEELVEANRPVREAGGWSLVEHRDQAPLYVPLDKEPVATLLAVYQEETGDTESRPGTMGGGTYARATPNAVAFGAAFPGGSDGPAHEPDERIAVASLVKAAKIYAHALLALTRV